MKPEISRYYPIIEKSHFFDNIPQESFPKILEYLRAEKKPYKKGDTIINIGDKFHHAGIILSGTIEGSFLNESYDQISMNRFHEGETFGESMACAEIGISPMQIRSVTDCLLLFLDFSVLYHTKSESAYQINLATNLLRSFAKKNVFLNQKVRILSQRSLRDRILIYFRSLQTDTVSGIIHVPLNQTAMAEFLGVNRSALSRELGRMSDAGIIKSNGKNSYILNEDAGL